MCFVKHNRHLSPCWTVRLRCGDSARGKAAETFDPSCSSFASAMLLLLLRLADSVALLQFNTGTFNYLVANPPCVCVNSLSGSSATFFLDVLQGHQRPCSVLDQFQSVNSVMSILYLFYSKAVTVLEIGNSRWQPEHHFYKCINRKSVSDIHDPRLG